MELSDYLRILRAYWVGILVLTLVGGAAAFGWATLQSPRYAANASGFVTAGTSDNLALASAGDALAKSRAKSYVDLAKGRATAERVIGDLGLDTTPSALITRISVSQPLDTVLIEVTAQAGTPTGASALADAWIAALAAEVKSIEGGEDSLSLRVVPVEAAAVPTSPVFPNTRLAIALGLLIGLAVGVAYAVVRNQLDRRIRSASAVEKQFGLPVVASIPTAPQLAVSRYDPTAVANDMRNTPYGEAFRKLRTNLQFMDVDNPPRVIIVTSPNEHDGKSTVAARLAMTASAGGQPVILVDGDLRRPTVAERFGIEGAVGLTDVLVGTAKVVDVTVPWGKGIDLFVLPAGRIPPNPSELLGSKAMSNLLDFLGQKALVIVDAPPLLPVTDAAVLTARADGAFIVVSAGHTLDRDLEAALGHVNAVKGKPLGVVLNRVAKRDREAGNFSSYYAKAPTGSAPKTGQASATKGGASKGGQASAPTGSAPASTVRGGVPVR
ncbi:polysaccharide biosynthesis tyrosine autokinase [Rathayibacter sp. YIM 133350]|uniref:polysaccharide biosynthesis tyrosine autokinase n=1 Tax=Rathayibacter sp. YIM 133350 TaxID=3131992 RepID=UPI00307DA9B8